MLEQNIQVTLHPNRLIVWIRIAKARQGETTNMARSLGSTDPDWPPEEVACRSGSELSEQARQVTASETDVSGRNCL